ncbi:MAG: Ig-like domain-containing protein [Akkermansiaceae bacterium]|nr:Ig-like domain-containing protein [Akkermansiaceae bacterium]
MKPLALLLGLAATAAAHTLIGWNNLGMHCMDDDYSVFSILPPYNTVDCQLLDAQGHLVTNPTGLVVTYEAVADPDGSINTSSIGKTNFWQYSPVLFNAPLPPDYGLPFPAGNPGRNMPGAANTPQAMGFDGAMRWFEAAGVPITPIDDAGQSNPYPMMRLTAKTTGGAVLATTDIVLPVSSEMDCRACHSSGSGDAAKPVVGWVNEADSNRDHRLNILRLHDRHVGTQPFDDALAAKGFPPEGLEASVRDHDKPVLCAACHASEALGAPSYTDVKSLTRSMHSKHADVIAPDSGMTLNDIANRSSCYQCHPGSETRCLRGAMGAAVAADGSAAMQCQSCHGTMSQVGAADRTGWLDEPTCQQCHTGSATQNNGRLRYTSVFETNGTPRVPVSQMFATNPNTPIADKSLYRFSKGHGGLQCSACHGSTHAEFPAAHRNDNLQNIAAQGHAGTRANCTSCHSSMPPTVSGGPHGMHSTGADWISNHKDYGKSGSCLACHGPDMRGTPLSRSFSDQTLAFTKDGTPHSIPLFRGAAVSCFLCHKREDNGALGGVFNSNVPPVVTSRTLTTAVNTPGSLTLSSNEAGATPRIVSQPLHGSVALSGATATYYPESHFAGADSFTFAAFDGFADSNLGLVSVTIGDPATAATLDSDGDQWPDLVEYALGLTIGYPNAPLARNMSLRDFGGVSYWTMRTPRAPAPGDAAVGVEFSSDLIHWVPGVNVAGTFHPHPRQPLKTLLARKISGLPMRFPVMANCRHANSGG